MRGGVTRSVTERCLYSHIAKILTMCEFFNAIYSKFKPDFVYTVTNENLLNLRRFHKFFTKISYKNQTDVLTKIYVSVKIYSKKSVNTLTI